MSNRPDPSERWAQIEKLFHAALEKAPQDRAGFLHAACGSDATLLREVGALLDRDGGMDSLLEQPALAHAGLLARELGIGTMMGPYRVVARLGAGGMGEVYRAHDPRMWRDVAIKVTDERFSDRFAREVRMVAALNHPNVCQVHDVGPNYLVMELCEGETLAARLKRGRLPMAETLRYAAQLADALSAAHSKGIVHRDLKPANIMLTSAGVKVLDFGLAKLTAAPVGGGAPMDEPNADSQAGAIVGTAAYMSPEQAEGKPIDARSDVFSFGAVLYEMVTGRRAFPGDSKISTLSAVLTSEPVSPGAEVPHDLQKLISRCLRKDAVRRLQHMNDIKVVLEELQDEQGRTGNPQPAAAPARTARWRRWPAIAALLLVALTGAFVYFGFAPKPDAALKVVRLTSYPGVQSGPSFSPDGTQVAFAWNGEKQDNADIYVKLVSGGLPLRLTTDPIGEYNPAWSPEGSQIAFLRSGFIFLISPLGGPERKLTKAMGSLSWSPDGKSLAFSDRDSATSPQSIYLVSVATGERRKVTSPNTGVLGGDVHCAYSPDGRSLAVVRHLNGVAAIYILPLANNAPSGEPWRLTHDKRSVEGLAWMPDGQEIVYSSNRGGRTALWRIPVSPGAESRRVPGSEDGNLPAISRGPSPRLAFQRMVVRWNIWGADITSTGMLAGPPKRLIASTGVQSDPQFSPDGKRIAFTSNRSDERELWIAESTGANPVQLTAFNGARVSGAPRWSPNGDQIVFDSTDGVSWDIFVIAAGGGAPRLLTNGTARLIRPSWSRDGRWVYFASDVSGAARQIWKIPAEGGKAVQVTRGGGVEAFESHDGKTLYFAKGFGTPGIMSVPVNGGAESLVTDSAHPGHWAVAEKGILYVDYSARVGNGPAPLQFYHFETRRVTQLGLLDKIALNRLNTLSVTRDGRHVIWCQLDSAESDLMLVENFR